MSHAIDDLRHEHEAIQLALKILVGMARELQKGSAVDRGDLVALIGLLKEFADKCHHGKEEGLLFPALQAAGLPSPSDLVETLLLEHAQGRHWIREMEASIAETLDPGPFSRAALGYAELLRAHIQKEDNDLFPMAERLLTTTQLDRLFEAFEAHEALVIGPGRHEELHALLKALKLRYSQ